MTPGMREVISSLDPQWREYFEERAGILEYCCNVLREEAEGAAFRETTAAILKEKERKSLAFCPDMQDNTYH